jgi:uncharacterized protein (DUF4415 family)
MAVRRIGSNRLPDDPSNIWNASTFAAPGDVMHEAPGFGGQSLREAPGPIITESHMVASEAPKPKKRGRPAKPKPAVQEAPRAAKAPSKPKATPSQASKATPSQASKATPSQASKAPSDARKKVKGVVADGADLSVVLHGKPDSIPINLRMPPDLLARYKEGGSGYQTRIIAALRAFLDNGGEFVAA